ncbi:MAG: hypothetical protein IPN04_02960 [Rhodoferax sp.]|nr:hypothetical protein [Rhodoferax sp.]
MNGLSVGHFDDISQKCAEKGLWIVPVGELEGFCRSIAASHGPDFVEKVLEQRDLSRIMSYLKHELLLKDLDRS